MAHSSSSNRALAIFHRPSRSVLQMDMRGEGSSATEGTVLFNSQQEESVMGMSTSASSNRGHGTTTHSSSGAVRTFESDLGGTPTAPIVASGGTHSSPGACSLPASSKNNNNHVAGYKHDASLPAGMP